MADASHFRSMSAPLIPQLQPRVLNSDDVEQGNILWLAPYEETLASVRRRRPQCREPVLGLLEQMAPEERFYDHPILVVSRPAKGPDSIFFLPLTSFGGKDIRERFKGRAGPYNWLHYLAISTVDAHPLFSGGDETYRTLHLEGGLPMNKPGYVNVSKVYKMDWRDAQPYWRANATTHRITRLDRPSMDAALLATARLTGYKPKEQYNPRLPAIHRPMLSATRSGADLAAPRSSERGPPEEPLDPLVAQLARKPVPATVRFPKNQIRSDGRNKYSGEREPLLPIHYNVYSIGGHVRGDGLFARLWNYLKWTRLAIVVCFLYGCIYVFVKLKTSAA